MAMTATTVDLDNSCALSRAQGLVLVTNTPKGRGVFASQLIPKGTVVEVSPVLVFSEEEVNKYTKYTSLEHYTYYWPSPSGNSQTQAVALGLGSMFNHSTLYQNVTWSRDLESSCIVYTAHREIQAGEELCISYGSARLWFEDADVALINDPDDVYQRIRNRLKPGEAEDSDSQKLAELELSGLDELQLSESRGTN